MVCHRNSVQWRSWYPPSASTAARQEPGEVSGPDSGDAAGVQRLPEAALESLDYPFNYDIQCTGHERACTV
jgi:hypothetical protein